MGWKIAGLRPFSSAREGTNFPANWSKRPAAGVVGELVTPRMPNTQSDPGLLHSEQKLIFQFLPPHMDFGHTKPSESAATQNPGSPPQHKTLGVLRLPKYSQQGDNFIR